MGSSQEKTPCSICNLLLQVSHVVWDSRKLLRLTWAGGAVARECATALSALRRGGTDAATRATSILALPDCRQHGNPRAPMMLFKVAAQMVRARAGSLALPLQTRSAIQFRHCLASLYSHSARKRGKANLARQKPSPSLPNGDSAPRARKKVARPNPIGRPRQGEAGIPPRVPPRLRAFEFSHVALWLRRCVALYFFSSIAKSVRRLVMYSTPLLATGVV